MRRKHPHGNNIQENGRRCSRNPFLCQQARHSLLHFSPFPILGSEKSYSICLHENFKMTTNRQEIFLQNTTFQIVNLGVDSFFHLGTHSEFVEHISPNSKFLTKISGSNESSLIYSKISKQQVNNPSNQRNVSFRARVLSNSQMLLPWLSGRVVLSAVSFPTRQ